MPSAELHARLRVRSAPRTRSCACESCWAARGESGTSDCPTLGHDGANCSKWRRRYRAYRLAGLTDAPRAGRPRSGRRAGSAHCGQGRQSKPDNATHWSVRQMSRHAGVSPATVQRIWHAFGLKPHLQETFCHRRIPYFVDKVRDVVGCIWHHPIAPWCCAWTRRARSRL